MEIQYSPFHFSGCQCGGLFLARLKGFLHVQKKVRISGGSHVKIGVDISSWIHPEGQGRYTRELLLALLAVDQHNDYLFFLDSKTAASCKDLPESNRIQRIVVKTSDAAILRATAWGRRPLSDLWEMGEAVQRYGRDLDLFFFPGLHTFFPLRTHAKIIVTIHDTFAERHPRLVFPTWHNQFFWKLKSRWALRQADLITTVSETSRQDLIQRYNLVNKKVTVIPNGTSRIFRPLDHSSATSVTARYGLRPDERFILYVGGFGPHKNLTILLEAYDTLLRRGMISNVKLVLVGDFQSKLSLTNYDSLRTRMTERGLTKQVVFTGYLHDEELVHIYNQAALLVLPSLDESFGLTGLEAMACGTPVVASRVGALPEVMGEAAQYFDPRNASQLTERLQSVLTNDALRETMHCKGLERAQQFSWQNSAEALLKIFEECIPSHVETKQI